MTISLEPQTLILHPISRPERRREGRTGRRRADARAEVLLTAVRLAGFRLAGPPVYPAKPEGRRALDAACASLLASLEAAGV